MSPSPVVAEALCCTAHTDSRPNSPQPFRRHPQQPKPDGKPTTQKPLLDHQEPNTSRTNDDIELQQIFAEAGSTLPPSAGLASSMALLGQTPRSRPATAVERTPDESKSGNNPKKRKLLKRLTRDLSRSNLSLSNLKKTTVAKEKAQQEQQQDSSGNKKVKSKKSKPKSKSDDEAVVEMQPVGTGTREVLLDRTYDSDAVSLPDIRDSVVERLTKKVTLPENDEEKARLSPIKSKRSTDRRGDVSSIEWIEKGRRAEPYGWDEPSNSAPVLSLHIPERLSDLGVLPVCNGSAEDLLQLYQSSGRSSPWKKFAEQHLRRRSKSEDNLKPVTPDLKATEVPNLSPPFNGKAWRLSSEGTPTLNLPLSEPKHTIAEDKTQEEARNERKLNETRLFPNKAPFASPPITNRGTDTSYRTVSEALPDAEYRTLSVTPSVARRASVNGPLSNLPDPESRSVHLHNMRISQHLRSDSTLSGVSGTPTSELQQQLPQRSDAKDESIVGGGEPGVVPSPPLHTQQSDSTVRTARRLRGSSSGFASERVPEGWGNVVSGVPSSMYEPSSVYSTRQNSLTSNSTRTPVASSRVNIPASYFASGHGTIVRKSGYEVLNLGDMGMLRMEDAEADEKEKASAKKDSVEASTMPGAFPPSSSTNLLKRADTGLTFRTANERLEAAEKGRDATKEKGKRPAYEFVDSSDQTTDTGEYAPLKSTQQSSEETTDSSLDITPVTAIESPMSSDKTPRAQIVTPAPSALPSSGKHKKKTPSIKTPSKRFSTFSFFRSKTYSNLRRASHSPALHLRKRSKSNEHLTLDGYRDKASKEARGFENYMDGPSDARTPPHSLGNPPDREQQQSTTSEVVEEYRPGRLSRSWLIGDGRSDRGQDAVWEKALKKHHEEKSALFLSPEQGGKAEARSLFRERSGSGSALSARSQLSDRKGKGPAIGGDFTFGRTSPGLQRLPTMLLDPLETMELGEESMQQRGGSGMLGDELRWSKGSGSLTPATGISPGASIVDEPSVVSVEKDLHIDTWGGTTLAEIELGDLGVWSRFPSHTRELRTGAAGAADLVGTRDFAYEVANMPRIENESSTEDENEDASKSVAKRITTLRSKKGSSSKTRSGMSKSKSMTFSRNFSFLKHYIGLFRSQSEEFRRHGHGHRSSVAESATLEHPELEILPPVFSPVGFEFPPSPQGLQADGAASRTDLTAVKDEKKTTGVEAKAKESKVEFKVQPPSRREESKTDSSDGSWTANARLFTHAFDNETGRGKRAPARKVDTSAEWLSNARTWTRFSTPSQDFQDVMDDAARQRFVMTPTRLGRQIEDPTEESIAVPERVALLGNAPLAKRSSRGQQSSSEEWRSDARLFSQMYESCVQAPNFGAGGSEDANACEPSSSGAGFRLASTGHLNGLVEQAAAGKREKARFRTLSGGYGGNAGKKGEKDMERNDSFLSVGSAEGTTMDLMRYLQELEEGERAKLEAEKAGV